MILTIESNQVTIIQGSTGSGKTTQVPQYILDHYAEKGEYCNIIVTQPRRIAAVSIARRVSQERGWPLGSVCGYQVGTLIWDGAEGSPPPPPPPISLQFFAFFSTLYSNIWVSIMPCFCTDVGICGSDAAEFFFFFFFFFTDKPSIQYKTKDCN